MGQDASAVPANPFGVNMTAPSPTQYAQVGQQVGQNQLPQTTGKDQNTPPAVGANPFGTNDPGGLNAGVPTTSSKISQMIARALMTKSGRPGRLAPTGGL